MPSQPLLLEIQEGVTAALRAIPDKEKAQLYALSFFIYDNEDDPRQPTLTVGYNTEAQWKKSIPNASSSDEAKWNYAFWLQNEISSFGQPGSSSAQTVSEWVRALGLAYSDQEEEDNFDECMELGEQITNHFVQTICQVAKNLHESGIITTVFGRPIPILIHELEYYGSIADQTEYANPAGVADAFVGWVRGGCV